MNRAGSDDATEASTTPAPVGDLASSTRVQIWFEGLQQSWGSSGLDGVDAKLETLARFCAYSGKDPDTIVGECLKAVEGGYEKVRYKARHRYIDLIARFEEDDPGGRTAGNVVRSFLIHNGVAMGTRALR